MSTARNSERCVIVGSRSTELPVINSESGLSVFVVFTSIHLTLKALEKARKLARSLGANVAVIAVQVVPYPLPLDEPSVPFGFLIRRFEEEAGEFPEKTQVSAYLCRDPMEALKRILNPWSPVVIGVTEKWLPTREQRLARKLRRSGYHVLTAGQE